MKDPNKDSLHNIKKWLKKREIEEPVEEKKKDKALTDIAIQIRTIRPLPKGRCHLCGGNSDALVPLQMKCCLRCCKNFIKRAGALHVMEKEPITYYCDNCLVKSFGVFNINPLVCEKCNRKIGKFHKQHLKEMKEQQIKEMIKKNV